MAVRITASASNDLEISETSSDMLFPPHKLPVRQHP
jgi:hypothetical protein